MKILFVMFLITVFLIILPQKIGDSNIKTNLEEKIEKRIFEIIEDLDNYKIIKQEEQPVDTPKPTVTPTTEWWKYPKEILTTKRSGDDLLVLVNKTYKLPSTYAPSDLVKASNSGIRRGENYYLRNILINDLKNLINDSKQSGADLSIVSGYRSYKTQVDTYNYWLSKNNNDVEYVDTFSARPGHSQHQLGTAIDFSSNEIGDVLGDTFANTKASEWLKTNAYKYGFIISFPKGFESITGYKHESWHYRYIGVENALSLTNKGLILETYLVGLNP